MKKINKPNIKVTNPLKLNFVAIYEIATKDLKGFFDSIYGYLLIIIFLAPLYFIFLQRFFISQIASVRQVFELLPTLLIIFVPAVTMGSFARETDKQTMEYIVTKPVRPIEIVIGKIIASFVFCAIAILLTLPLPLMIRSLGNIDMGETAAGYIAALLLILGLTSLGVMVSSFFKNQISAFLTTIFLIFVLIMVGGSDATNNLPQEVSSFLSSLSIMQYYGSLTRGVIDVGDVLYYLLLTFIGATIAYVNVIRIRISNTIDLYRRAIFVLGVVGLITFWMIYLSRNFEFRYDITQSKKYTLSKATKDLIKKDGKIDITVYSSSNLPLNYKMIMDEVKNTLSDYKLIGGNNLNVQYVDTKGREAEIEASGIQPMQFNEVSNDQFQLKQGYLGILVKNEAGDKKEVIPFVNSISDVEYQVTRLINKVKQTDLPRVTFASGNGEFDQYKDHQLFSTILQDNFKVDSVYVPTNDPKTSLSLEGVSILVLANPTTKYNEESIKKISEFLNNGGKVIYSVDAQNIDENGQITPFEEKKVPQTDLLSSFGLKVSNEIVYDLKNASFVTVQTQSGIPFSLQYPFFVNAELATKDIKFLPPSVLTPWSNYLVTEGNDWKPVYATSDRAGQITEPYNIQPNQNLPQENLSKKVIVAYRDFGNGGRLIAIANARMLKDSYLSNSQTNMNFAYSIAESLGQSVGLSEIKAKDYFNSQFTSVDLYKRNLIKFGSVGSSFALLMLIAAYRILRKRMTIKKILKYT